MLSPLKYYGVTSAIDWFYRLVLLRAMLMLCPSNFHFCRSQKLHRLIFKCCFGGFHFADDKIENIIRYHTLLFTKLNWTAPFFTFLHHGGCTTVSESVTMDGNESILTVIPSTHSKRLPFLRIIDVMWYKQGYEISRSFRQDLCQGKCTVVINACSMKYFSGTHKSKHDHEFFVACVYSPIVWFFSIAIGTLWISTVH